MKRILPALLVMGCLANVVRAGGGPETTLVVVNADSALSVAIANRYAALRGIPDSHLVWLRDIPVLDALPVEEFRDRILLPVLAHMETHGIEDEIDLVAYSVEFPYDVDFSTDLKRLHREKDQVLGAAGSLTGMTFYGPGLLTRPLAFAEPNLYYRNDLSSHRCPPQPPVSEAEQESYARAVQMIEGDRAGDALPLLEGLRARHPGSGSVQFQIARAQAAAGREDAAFDALRRAIEACFGNGRMIRNDRLLKPLADDARFDRLIAGMESRVGPFEQAVAFSGARRYSTTGLQPTERRYLLSVMLGWAGEQGNTREEIEQALERAAASDGTRPAGTVYLLQNDNVRSTTRQPLFGAAERALKERGRRVEVLSRAQRGQDGILPRAKEDVIGAVIGTAKFDWEASNSVLLPGAIAEALTSYGARFRSGKQTKLTELIRHGAAGASGAVVEPYALQSKFPTPMLHVHYADGASLAEAFYQSIVAPYQLLIVGDPLARPFASLARVELDAPDPESSWRGVVDLRSTVRPAAGKTIARTEVWIDGQRTAQARPTQGLSWDTRTVPDGAHDLALVAIEDSPVATQSRSLRVVVTDNHGQAVTVDPAPRRARMGERLEVTGQAPPDARMRLARGARVYAETRADAQGRWTAHIEATDLGAGDARFTAEALDGEGRVLARSRPVFVAVEPATPWPASAEREGIPGLRAEILRADGRTTIDDIEGLDALSWQEAVKDKEAPGRVLVEGAFRVDHAGLHELVFRSAGRLSVTVGGRALGTRTLDAEHPETRFALSLAPGWHTLQLLLEPHGRLRLDGLLAGATPGALLKGDRVRHAEP